MNTQGAAEAVPIHSGELEPIEEALVVYRADPWENLPLPDTGSNATRAIVNAGWSDIVRTAEAGWRDIVRAAETTSFSFLAGEPDLYSLEDGEPV